MFYGILIGFIFAFIVDFIITYFITESLSTVIIRIITTVYKTVYNYVIPLIRLDITIWLIKHHYNPWHTSVSEMLSVSDDEFEEWLILVGKKNRPTWEKMRKLRKKMK